MMNNLYGIVAPIRSGKDETAKMLLLLKDDLNLTYEDYLKITDVTGTFEIRKYATKLKQIICVLINCTMADLEDQDFKARPIPGFDRYVVKANAHCGVETFLFSTLKKYQKSTEPGGKLYGTQHSKPKLTSLTPRILMEIIGTGAGREMIHPDLWCKSLFAEFTDDSKWIISDLRYPTNETDHIRDNGGVVIGIKRRFGLRFPDYAHLEDERYPYKIPHALHGEDPDLYERLTFDAESAMGDLSWVDYTLYNDGTLEELFEGVRSLLKTGI